MPGRMLGVLITLLAFGAIIYFGLPRVFAGETHRLAGYLLLLISFALTLVLTRALKREIERFTLPPVVAFGRLATQVFFIGAVAGYPALGLGDFSDLAWALTLFFPYMTAVSVETMLRWNSHGETTQPFVFTSSLIPRIVASGLLALALWKWSGMPPATLVFLIIGAGTRLLGAKNAPQQVAEGVRKTA